MAAMPSSRRACLLCKFSSLFLRLSVSMPLANPRRVAAMARPRARRRSTEQTLTEPRLRNGSRLERGTTTVTTGVPTSSTTTNLRLQP